MVTLHLSVFITTLVRCCCCEYTHEHTHNYGLVAVPIRGITDVYKAAARSGSAHFAHSPNTVKV